MFHIQDPTAGRLFARTQRVKKYIYARYMNVDPEPFCYQGDIEGSELQVYRFIPGGYATSRMILKNMDTGVHEYDIPFDTPYGLDDGYRTIGVNYLDRRTAPGIVLLSPDTNYRVRVKLNDLSIFFTRELDESHASVNTGAVKRLGSWPAVDIDARIGYDECSGGKCRCCRQRVVTWGVTVFPHEGFDIRGARVDVFKRSPWRGGAFDIDELEFSQELDGLPTEGAWLPSTYYASRKDFSGPLPHVKVGTGDKVDVFVTVETNDHCTVQFARQVEVD